MKRYVAFLAVILLFGGGPAWTQETDPKPVSELRTTVEKWVQTRRLISRERTDWAQEKRILNQSIEMFRKELERIDAEIAEASEANRQAEKEQHQLLEENEALTRAFDQLAARLAELEKRLLGLHRLLPSPIAEKVEPFIRQIPSDPAKTKRSISQRMQSIIGVLNEVEKFNGSISVFSEIRQNKNGKEIQVQTLYVGLGQAYFVDRSGDYAGVGIPSSDGWQWEDRSEWSATIRRAIEIYETTRPAAFIEVPLKVN